MGASVETLVEVYYGKEWNELDKDIFPVLESYQNIHGEKTDKPFKAQHYGLFAFIGDVRNYNAISPIAPYRGLPDDHKSIEEIVGFDGRTEMVSRYSYRILEGHSQTWVSAQELIDFDYEQVFEDRRDYNGVDGSVTLAEANEIFITYREFLGEHFFKELDVLKEFDNPQDVRIIFAFES